MKKYCVLVREVHVAHYIIEAESETEAKELATNQGELSSVEYSHTMDVDTWTVQNIP